MCATAALLQLLTQRFGRLSGDAHARVEAASSDELFAWTSRVLQADTVDDVLGPV